MYANRSHAFGIIIMAALALPILAVAAFALLNVAALAVPMLLLAIPALLFSPLLFLGNGRTQPARATRRAATVPARHAHAQA